MKKKIALILTDGFEEVEAITPMDILRRAGAELTTVSLTGRQDVRGAHDIVVIADKMFEEMSFEDFDLIILPGGPGAKTLDKSQELKEVLDDLNKRGKMIAAICAAPIVLGHMGLLEGKNATCYPGNEKELHGAHVKDTPVEVSGNITTGRGVGAALTFSLKIVEQLYGKKKAGTLAEKVVYMEAVA